MELIFDLPDNTNPDYARRFAQAIEQTLHDLRSEAQWTGGTQYHREPYGTVSFELPFASAITHRQGMSIDVAGARIK